jgi:hypothetical protein
MVIVSSVGELTRDRLLRAARVRGVGLASLIGVLFVVCCIVGGCGSPANGSAAHSAGTTLASSTPGCNQFCAQAGPSAGDNPLADPCPTTGCLPCPSGGCIVLMSSNASVQREGIFAVSLRCVVSRPCVGAFVVYAIGGLTINDRLAGSNISVPSDQTDTVNIATTRLGSQLARSPGGYRGTVIMVLQGSGDQAAQDTLTLHG